MSDDITGKLAYAKELDLITQRQRRFIRALSTLRNRLVHNIEMLNFSFSSYVKSMDSVAKRNWQDDIIWFELTEDARKVWRKVALDLPKVMLWFSIVELSFLLITDTKQAQMTHDIPKLADENGKVEVKELIKAISKSISGGLTSGSS